MNVPARLATLALAAICVAALAATASAAKPSPTPTTPPTLVGSDYLVPPGKTLTFSGMTISSCNSASAGVNIQQEGVGVWPADFGNNYGKECRSAALAPKSFTNDTTTDQTLRVWLNDDSCGRRYYADGGHALITAGLAALNDGGSKQRGADCVNVMANSVPTQRRANFSAQVSID